MAEKKRIAHIITRLDWGGSAENTLLTVTHLDKSRHEVTLIYGETVEGLEDQIKSAEGNGVQLIYLKELVRHIHPWLDTVALWKLYRLMKREKFDLVHTHSSKAGVLGRQAAILAGVRRIVHTPHGHVFYGYFGPFTNLLILWIERFLGRWTDRLITLTHRGREEHVARRILPPEKIVPIYSGIRLEIFQNFEPSKELQAKIFSGIPPGPRIGLGGRLVPVKGHRYLLEAVPRIVRDVPDARFLLAGDGPLRKELEKKCRELGINSSVFFLGSQKDIRPFLYGVDLIVLPSLNEGMGRILLEAQAMGKPVIGTSVGGIPEVIRGEETGLIIPPKDPEALAAAILQLLKDPGRRERMGQRAKEWVDQRFGVERMVEQAASVYEALL